MSRSYYNTRQRRAGLNNRLRSMLLLAGFAAVCCFGGNSDEVVTASDTAPDSEWLFVVSPMFGINHNALKRPDREGREVKYTKNAPEYGLYLMALQPHVVVNNFLFFTETVDEIDVVGNLFYANFYGDPAATVTWNVGVGHLYHDIKRIDQGPNRDRGTIRVRIPQVKAGPMIRIKSWHLALNPYLGYAWERTGMKFAGRRNSNNSWMYGITADWRWRMLNFNAKYVYQDSSSGQENFNSIHLRLVAAVTRNWGMTARFDHMEHATTDDTSFLIGPVFVF